jgi:hypothetical protein
MAICTTLAAQRHIHGFEENPENWKRFSKEGRSFPGKLADLNISRVYSAARVLRKTKKRKTVRDDLTLSRERSPQTAW